MTSEPGSKTTMRPSDGSPDMTTATPNPAASESTRRDAGQGAGPRRFRFRGVWRGEWIKLASLRSIRWSIALMILLTWAGALLMSIALAATDSTTPETMPGLIVQSATLGSLFTVLIMGVLGVLSITSEYATGLILSSLMAVPTRIPLLAAKTLVVGVLGFAVGIASAFGGALIAALLLGEGAFAAFGSSAVLAALVSNAVYLMLAALFALGVGALLRSTAGAISAVVVVFFVATIALQMLNLTGWAWVETVVAWMPASLGSTLTMSSVMPELSPAVGYWSAMLGLVVWAALPFLPATILLKTRDAV
ncbi:MAG: ABC transporter permease [Leucobacter sp.]|nr:ABC transporter permease [Leucobacter sp.]